MKMPRHLPRYLTLLVLSMVFLAACGTLEVGIERTPTPDHAATATVAALPTESTRLATQVATLATPTPTPSLGKLAYVQSDDVWIKALPDGKPQRLTADGRNREPRWSPSSGWLAFRKGDYQVWVMRADGSAARPLNEGAAVGAFAWAPRADRLAYITGTGALVAVNAGGSNRQELVVQGSGEPYTGVVNMAWSPDEEWLAYEWVDVLQKEQPAGRYAGLWRIRADGSEATELLNAGAPATYELILAGWSPDGSGILFWEDPQFSRSLLADGVPLLALPADGGVPVQLAETVLAYPDFVVPGPTGTAWLAVIVGGYRGAWTNKVLHVVLTSTGEDVALTSPDLAASSPAWSPGGTYDILRDWNPTIAQDDYATLFKNGCAMNGLKCLSIRTIVREEQVSPEFRFTVEFMNDDGTLFVRGPCCSATETELPPQTQFAYAVKKIEDRFLVQDLPVYVP
jgi:hypothetical protein